MDERLAARLLFGLGLLPVSLMTGWFGWHWSTSGPILRAVFVVGVVATAAGLALDVKHRREDRQRDAEAAG